jgi:2'-5' RNA ligase
VSDLDAQGFCVAGPSMPDFPELSDTELATAKERIRAAWLREYPDADLPESFSLSERGITAITLAEGSYSGLLVALWLDPVQAAQLVVPGGEAADQLHVTLCYCADMANTDDVTLARIVASLADVAATYTDMGGKVGGFGRFYAGESSDGQDVFYAAPDMPGLDYFREAVLRALGSVYVYTGDSEHSYVPHITLSYLPAKAKTPANPPAIDLTFSAITVVAGERRIDIPFWQPSEGTEYVGMYDNAYAYYAEKAAIKPAKGKVRETWRFSSRVSLAEPAEWIQWLPAPGTYHHARWGELRFTPEKLERLVQHFHEGVYGQELPVDIDHELKLSGAVGYITDMRLAQAGGIEVKVNWTDRGTLLLAEDRFKYVSADYFEEWQSPVTGEWIPDVPAGMAICTHPHFKTDVLRPLAASEIESLHFGEARKESIGMTEAEKKTPPADAVQFSEDEIREFRAFKEQGGLEKLTELNQVNEKLSTDVAGLQADARKKRFTDLALGRGNSGDGAAWQGGADKHVPFLTKLAEKFGDDSEEVAEYIDMQKSQATAFAEAMKPLLTATGTSRGGDEAGSALGLIEAEAAKLMEADSKLTREQAIDKVYSSNPKLKEAYRAERRVNRSDEN